MRAEKVMDVAASPSLMNWTLAPGWTEKESEVLKYAIMKFGVGKWGALLESGLLPHKKLIQCFIQTQRLLGQQRLATLQGLHVDVDAVLAENLKRKDAYRKHAGGFVVETGDRLTPRERIEARHANKRRFGLDPHYLRCVLRLPRPQHVRFYQLERLDRPRAQMSTATKVAYLNAMRTDLINKVGQLAGSTPSEDGPKEFAPQPYALWRQDKEQGLPCSGCG